MLHEPVTAPAPVVVGFRQRVYDHLARLVTQRWWLVILIWVLGSIGLRIFAPRWNDVTHDGDLAYLPANMASVTGERLLEEAFPGQLSKSQVVIVLSRPNSRLRGEDYQFARLLASEFAPEAGHDLPIVEVLSRDTEVIGTKLRSEDRQSVLTVLKLENEFMATDNIRVLEEIRKIVDSHRSKLPEGLQLGITGSAAVGGDMLGAASESIKNTELTTVVMVLIILLIVYRAPLLVLIPLTAIAFSVHVATSLVAALTQLGEVPGFEWWNFKIFTTTKIFIVVILFGAGTDFCLFLIARYREELEHGLHRVEALGKALSQVGDALLASALTTIVGLSMMFFADFGKFRNSGPAIGLCLAVALTACMTLAPALLRVSGRWAFWPGRLWRRDAHFTPISDSDESSYTLSGLWDHIARAVVTRPGWILAISVAVLIPFAWEGLSVKVTYDLLNELQPSVSSVQGAKLLREHFPAGETGPVTVLAFRPDGGFDTKEGREDIGEITKDLYEMESVHHVRSLTEPLGDAPGYINVFSRGGQKKIAAMRHRRTLDTYLTQEPDLQGGVTRFDVVLNHEPFSTEAIGALDTIESHFQNLQQSGRPRWKDTQFELAGTTAAIRDLKQVNESDRLRIQILVVIAVLFVILRILRRQAICVFLIISVLFSYFVTMGVTELVFAWLHGETFHGLDWKVPIFLFVILIAVGQDYNIYLVTRVFEEQAANPPLEGLRRAVTRTGSTITSCGIIMAATFCSMITGTMRGMHELGFALSLGILLDTFVIRPILVPAFLALLARRDHAEPVVKPASA